MSDTSTHYLYLSSFTGAPYMIDNANYAAVKFRIPWDNHFNRENYRYKSCRIRFDFRSDPSSATTYTYDPASFNGVIVIGGLPDKSGPKYGGTPVGLIGPYSFDYISNSTAKNTSVLLGGDLTSIGRSVQVPMGLSEITVYLYQNTFSASSPVLLNSIQNIGLGNWNLQLMFDFSDPVDEM